MSRLRTLQNSFGSGEISPLVRGRIDMARYFNGLDTCLNWVPLVQGAARVRGGLKYAGAAKSDSTACYLYPFTFSATDSYVLEFGNLYIRFWKYDANGEPAQVGAPYEVTTTYTTAQVDDIQIRQSGDVIFIAHPSHPIRKLTRVTETNWLYAAVTYEPPPTYVPKTDLNTTLYSSAATGDGRTFTAGAAVFLAADVGRHILTDDNDRAVIVGYTSTTVVTADILDGSFALVASPETAGTWDLLDSPNSVCQVNAAGPVGTKVTVTLYTTTAKSVTEAGFRSADAARYIHILGGTLFITSITSSTVAEARVHDYLDEWTSTVDYAIENTWTIEAATWTDARGYPASITLGEQRIWASGAAGEPDAIRATVVGDYYSFAPGAAADDDAIAFVLATNEVNIIRWLHFWKGLIVGALGGEILLRGSQQLPLTPSSPDMIPQTAIGVASFPPERLGNTLLFVDYTGRAVHAWTYDVATDSYEPDNLMDFASHLTESNVFQRSAAQKTATALVRNLVWYVRADGVLCCLTFNKKQQVLAWSRHSTATPGGTSTVMSACVIRNPVLNRDDLWLSITRTINATTQRTIEVMDWGKYLDCSLTYTGAATATITGLSHLNGDSVSIRGKAADGIWRLYPNQTVASNQVTGLSPTVTDAEVGYAITATLTTPRLEGQGVPSLQGRIKGIGMMVARFYDTPSIKIAGVRYKGGGEGQGLAAGHVAASVYVIPTGTNALAAASSDGEIELVGGTDYDRNGRVTIEQDLPLGGTVLLLAAEVDVGA